MLETGSDGL